MKQEEGSFRGVRGANLYHQAWLPEGEVRAVLMVIHGLAEHSGRYMNLVGRFVPQGYAVCGIDHLGHGRSDGRRLFVERFEDYTEPVDTLREQIRTRHPGRPVFLVGHSMGGLIAATHLLSRQDAYAGAVLSGPAVKAPGDLPKATIVAGKILSVIAPRLGLVPLDAEGVSRDPAVVRAYIEDPLVCRGKVTARLGAEMLAAMERLLAEAHRITLPLLIVQGGDDRLVDPAGARMLCDAVGSPDRKLIVYSELFHEVFNEPERERVFADIEAWLEAHGG